MRRFIQWMGQLVQSPDVLPKKLVVFESIVQAIPYRGASFEIGLPITRSTVIVTITEVVYATGNRKVVVHAEAKLENFMYLQLHESELINTVPRVIAS